MLENKNVLFIGLGSIGKRHLNLLKKDFNFKIYAYRTKGREAIPDVNNLYDLDEAFKIKQDIVFITNPTHLHIDTALACLKAGIKNIFIEKPLSNDLRNLDNFIEEVNKSNALVYIGNVLRHNPVMKRLKEIVNEIKGTIFYANTICSSYLPYWRPNRDYRKTYSSKKSEGGGVLLDLVHEFDYNVMLFGEIKSISGVYGKISDLEIDSEDFCDIFIKFNSNIMATIHLDCFSYLNKRIINIITPEKEISADLIKNEIIISQNQKVNKETFHFERDDYFKTQIKYFINGIEDKSKNISNLNESKHVLEKIINFKKNNKMITNK